MFLIILINVLVIMGLLLGYFADKIFKGERPHGAGGDVAAGVVTAVVVGIADWFLIPMFLPNLSEPFLFILSLIEPLALTLLVLWLMRYLKNR